MGKLQLLIAATALLVVVACLGGLIARPRILQVIIGVLPLPRPLRGAMLSVYLTLTLRRGAPILLLDGADRSLYVARILSALAASVAGGMAGGQVAGFAEAVWMYRYWQVGNPELFLFCWCVMMYGAVFAVSALGIGAGLVFLYLAFDRWPRPAWSFAFSASVTLAGIIVVVGRHRYARDTLGDHALSNLEILGLLGVAALSAFALGCLLAVVVPRLRLQWRGAIAATLACYLLVSLGAYGLGKYLEVPEPQRVFNPTPGATGPNILLIMADTLRADHLTPYFAGSPAKTPNVRKLAEEGTVFRQSFAHASWTRPSFATLFTGLYPTEHQTMGKASMLPGHLDTLAGLLSEKGYYTQGLANNRNLLPAYGFAKGFDNYEFLVPKIWFGATYSCEASALYGMLRLARLRLSTPRVDIEHFYQTAPQVNEKILDWLERKPVAKDYPWFLYCHYMDPHDPYMRADRPGEGYAVAQIGLNPDPAKYLAPMKRAYADEVEYLDHWLGELFAELKQRGEWENTMIVLTADHGEEFCEHGGYSHGPTLYDEVIHVPIIIKWPGNRLAGTVNEHIARHVDVTATMLAIAGARIPEQVRGISLVSPDYVFANEATESTFAQTDFLQNVGAALRTRVDKYITMNPGNPRDLPERAYYDLTQDPGEQENRVGLGGESEANLRKGLETFQSSLKPEMLEVP